MDFNDYGGLTPEKELNHWWHKTRFLYLDRVIRRTLQRFPGEKLRILEMGCGTAQNLRYLRSHPELSGQIETLVGVDTALKNDALRPAWLGNNDFLLNSFDHVQGDFHLLMALDVIEHVDDDKETLEAWVTQLKPGGTAFVTVPAFEALWSPHDDFLGHKRRYTRTQLYDLAVSLHLTPVQIHYFFGHLVIPAIARKLLMCQFVDRNRFGMRESNPYVNRLMYGFGKLEHLLPKNALMGTSISGILDKPLSH